MTNKANVNRNQETMEIPYQIRLDSLAHLLQLLSDSVNAQLIHKDTLQLSIEAELDFLTHVLQRQLDQQQVSEADQVTALEFIKQHFSSSPTTTLVNQEDKYMIN